MCQKGEYPDGTLTKTGTFTGKADKFMQRELLQLLGPFIAEQFKDLSPVIICYTNSKDSIVENQAKEDSAGPNNHTNPRIHVEGALAQGNSRESQNNEDSVCIQPHRRLRIQ